MRPVCVKCRCELRPARNGYQVEEMADIDVPYRIWETDLWQCPSCDYQIVMGFGSKPFWLYYEDGYPIEAARCDLRYWPSPEMAQAATGAQLDAIIEGIDLLLKESK